MENLRSYPYSPFLSPQESLYWSIAQNESSQVAAEQARYYDMHDRNTFQTDFSALPGVTFRQFGGPVDFIGMNDVVEACSAADGIEYSDTVDDFILSYSHLVNCDLSKDFLLAESGGRTVGYVRTAWDPEVKGGGYCYNIIDYILPEWRRRGLDRVLLHWAEGRVREVAGEHKADSEKRFDIFCMGNEKNKAELLESEGYKPVRWFDTMVRPSLDELPAFSLPSGFELRPAKADQYRTIWKAWMAALVDHWGFSEPSEEQYTGWMEDKRHFQPELWQVAWESVTGKVAGGVLGFIDQAENTKYGRLRGYTECISVGADFRRRGIARALIASSLQAQKAAGMTESALGVDSESLTGATRVYADCGFRVVRRDCLYRKPL